MIQKYQTQPVRHDPCFPAGPRITIRKCIIGCSVEEIPILLRAKLNYLSWFSNDTSHDPKNIGVWEFHPDCVNYAKALVFLGKEGWRLWKKEAVQ